MTLSVNDQLMVLHDILDEQTGECCGNIAEYQQIKRLVKVMMATNSISDKQLQQLLPEIYNYGRQGELAQNLEEHITTNRENIQNWMGAIQQASFD